MSDIKLMTPNWQVPDHIKAYSSTRLGGVSEGSYQGLNLGGHVEDDPQLVTHNRQLLTQFAKLPTPPVWLNQTHSTHIESITEPTEQVLDADASYTTTPDVVCAVMTADCLPLLLTDVEGSRVAAVHAGWRGLANGVIEQAVQCFEKPVIAWLGPAIGESAFEVGREVYEIFVGHSPAAHVAFTRQSDGKYLANMTLLAQQRLTSQGVAHVYSSDLCTYSDAVHFYSYRRDGITGRQASLIWIDSSG